MMDAGVTLDVQLSGMGTLSEDHVVGDDFEITNFNIGDMNVPEKKDE